MDIILNTVNADFIKNENIFKYKDIIRYELIDESTSQLISSSSITSSNVGKSVGGAIISGALLGNPTVGAVIGNSGKRTTETKYKTKTVQSYILNIYLNKLDNSIVKIKSNSRDKISEIISVLEYIQNNL